MASVDLFHATKRSREGSEVKRPVSVLFVCLGNVCRSPTAEAVFRAKVEAEHLDGAIRITSTGLEDRNVGKPPHPETQRILRANGIPIEGLRGKMLSVDEINEYDYILAMDAVNIRRLLEMGIDPGKVQLLTEFVPGKEGEDIPDPYFYGNFEGVYAAIDQAVSGLLAHIKARWSL